TETLMAANARHRWFYPWVPIGIAGGLAALVTWLLLLDPSGRQAQAGEPKLDAAAALQSASKKLLVAVTLVNPEAAGLRKGDRKAELLGPGDKVVDWLQKAVNQTDRAEAYRFEFATPKQPLDQLKVRYTFGKNTLERPLGKILLAKAHETALAAGQEFH